MPEPIILAPAEPAVNAELVDFLERLLDRAKAGEVLSLAAVGERTGREVFVLHSGDYNVFAMVGALEHLKTRLLLRVET